MTASAPLPAPLLEVTNLSVDINVPAGKLHAVLNVSFAVRPGETLCLVGESGCGKTITSLAVMRLLPASARLTAQKILFEGRDLTSATEQDMVNLRGNRMGMIFQDPMTSLNPVYTIGNQLEEIYLRHRSGSRSEARERAEYLLQRVGIMSPKMRLGQYPHELSGGLRQRMMIAMTLMCGPTLIIADEPTTALDVTVQVQILQLLAALQREFNMALILITHNLGVVARMANHLAVMYGGRIVETGTAVDVFSRPTHPYTRGLLECLPVLGKGGRDSRLGSIPGIVPSLIGDVSGCSFRNRCAHTVESCAAGEITMRDVNAGHSYRCVHTPDEIVSGQRIPASATA